jgi:hypothetical protein
MGIDKFSAKASRADRLSILLLCDDDHNHANTVLDHIGAFTGLSRHEVYAFNCRRLIIGNKFLNFDAFDVVIIHYSIFVISDYYIHPDLREKLRRFQGLKIQFIQDDYRRIDAFAAMMRYMGIHILFTLYPTPLIPKVWDESRLPGVVKISTLTGYVPDRLVNFKAPPLDSRPLDIGYRARKLPYWLGEFSQEKYRIGQEMLSLAEQYGLRCDISWREENRIYGRKWNKFISSCKATLGTESGSSITDFDGSVERQVQKYMEIHPDADFFEVEKKILKPYENNAAIKVISPRMFEAIAVRTALILFPGEYSGILKPWAHYIPLEKDFSNIAEVVDKLRDIEFLTALTRRAYEDIIASDQYSFQRFISEFDEVVTKYAKPLVKGRKLKFRLVQLESRIERTFFVRPLMYINKVKRLLATGYIIAKFLLRDSILRRIMVQCFKNVNYFKYEKKWKKLGQKIIKTITDLALIGTVRQAQTGTLKTYQPFSIQTSFNTGLESLVFTSREVNGFSSDTNEHLVSKESISREELWLALQNGLVKKIMWDHSAIGTSVKYPIIGSKHLHIRLGQYGIHNFDNLIKCINGEF